MIFRRLIGVLVVLLSLAFAGLSLAASVALRRSVTPLELERHAWVCGRAATILEARIASAASDVRVARWGAPNAVLLEAEDPAAQREARERIVEVYRALMEAHPEYLQLRLIGSARGGREVVRLERAAVGADVRELPDAELQPKGSRPYFVRALALPDGELHVTAIELNAERGRLQEPLTPVLRVATPVHGEGPSARGIVIVNVAMQPALALLRHELAAEGRAAYVYDAVGEHFVIHPEPGQEFRADRGLDPAPMPRWFVLPDTPPREPSASEVASEPGSETHIVAHSAVVSQGRPVFWLATQSGSDGSDRAGPVRVALGVFALVALLAVAAVGYAMTRAITRPIADITSAADAVSRGEVLALPTSAAGEIGVLARAIGRMETTLRERNHQLEGEQERLRGIVEGAPNALMMIDASGTIVLANRVAGELFGWSPEELQGRRVAELVPERHREAHVGHMSAFHARPSARAMGSALDVTALRSDGSELIVEIALNPIETAEGSFTLAAIIDVGASRTREAELRRGNAELEQFAYVAAHDLQEPLRMVASYTELLSEQYRGELDETAQRYITHAAGGARRMQQMVGDLLRYSRVQSQGRPLLPVRARPLVMAALAAAEPLPAGVSITVGLDDAPEVMADAGQLQRVFSALIDNALKFRRGKTVEVGIEAQRQGDEWRFVVQDDGIGVDPRHRERIFQLFHRLHEREVYTGSGVGLTLAKRIVERHDGRIWCESAAGGGAAFFFTLLAADAPRRPRISGSLPSPSYPNEGAS